MKGSGSSSEFKFEKVGGAVEVEFTKCRELGGDYFLVGCREGRVFRRWRQRKSGMSMTGRF